jgi:cobalt-zinc-cadmium efflux system membrane fusion protein
VDLGQRVAAGEALFVLESAAVGDLQARRAASRERVAAARANLVRQEALRADAVASQRALDVARQEREEAEADLRSIDSSLRISGASSGRRAGGFVVRSPIAGQVLRRPALVGSYAGEADSLATVADTTTMWVLLDVPEDAAPAVRVGHEVEIEVAGLPGRAFAGRVTWIASEVAARTRTVEARAEVQNDDGLLRAGQFARARVRVEAPRGAVAVPTAAVQRRGDESIVFVRVGEGTYEPRVVVPGRAAGPLLEVEGPVRAGDAVVTTGAFLLRTELDRGAIGSGCCETGRAGGG